MREEYDFSQGVRGKYLGRYRRGTNLVLLAPDVAKAFPDSESVNDALRMLLDIAKRKLPRPKRRVAVRPNKVLQRTKRAARRR